MAKTFAENLKPDSSEYCLIFCSSDVVERKKQLQIRWQGHYLLSTLGNLYVTRMVTN